MDTTPRLRPFGCALVAGVMLLAGCCPRKPEPAQDQPRSDQPAATVTVAPVTQQSATSSEEVVGTVRSKLTAKTAAKISGTIDRVLVTTGQEVKEGDLLILLDAKEMEAQREQSAAMLQQAEADLVRFTKLLADGAVTRQEFEQVQTRQRVGKARLDEVTTMLGYTRITAPFAGVISAKLADKGDLATPGKPLLEMEDPRAVRLEAFVPEAISGNVKLGESYPATLGTGETTAPVTVSELAPTADPSSRTFLVKFDLPAAGSVRPGQFGRVRIPVARTTTTVVPSAAVVVRGQLEMVFTVAADNRARMRLVRTGRHDAGRTEILSGVNPDEMVVVEGASSLVDGQPVIRKP